MSLTQKIGYGLIAWGLIAFVVCLFLSSCHHVSRWFE
jgi:hypothetical protein